MSCPAGFGEQPTSRSERGVGVGEIQEMLEKYNKEIIMDCTMPTRLMHACRKRVIDEQQVSCVKEAQCLEGCHRVRSKQERLVWTSCGEMIPGHGKDLEQRMGHCIQYEGMEACRLKLHQFEQCAAKMAAIQFTSHPKNRKSTTTTI